MNQPNVPVAPPMQLDQSVAKNLLFGEILEQNLFPYPVMRERDREMLGLMVDAIDRFLDGHEQDFRQWDEDAAQPPEFIQTLRELGLFGLIIPEAHGGLELSNAAYARVLAQTSAHDSSVSLTIGAHSSIGMKGILLYGTDEQKARYLPRLASGEMIAAFCLTEPRKTLDHQRRHRRPLHRVRPHRRRRGKDHRLRGRGRVEGRQPRPPRGQDGHPRLVHHHGRLRRRAGAA
jgi:alkylation response protein AidB-like acyl-CoA dehydrogenase